LENVAAEARHILESHIASVDSRWSDDARRGFETDHLAAIRSDARRLKVDLAVIAEKADQSARAVHRS
jgi:hypothetical protein